MTTLQKKINISIVLSFLFFLLNHPNSYKMFEKIFRLKLYENGCPTNSGLLCNTLVFFIITYLTMGHPLKNQWFKLKNTTYGTLIFYMISSPAMYYLTNMLLNNKKICPTINMVILHSVIYCLFLIGVMYFPE